ncbi:MAG: DUF1788 domain-containing protein [SAR324 cluster bacterium]|nr:DUF1788 domain-containing protein [SAR324 cluster bacterium]
MDDTLKQRWNQVLPRLQSEELQNNKGLGNEIGFYIFDYPPECELEIRESLDITLQQLQKSNPGLKVKHVNLFLILCQYLEKRQLLAPALKLQKEKGNSAMLKALKGPLHEEKVAQYFLETVEPNDTDLLLISRVGNVYPLLRTHTMLNNFHPLMKGTPLVMFYPGIYDGQHLRLFGKLKEDHYYRAFRLVS